MEEEEIRLVDQWIRKLSPHKHDKLSQFLAFDED